MRLPAPMNGCEVQISRTPPGMESKTELRVLQTPVWSLNVPL
jgi:hypothetical protein